MRRIAIIDHSDYGIQNNIPLNIAAEISRSNKKVLLLDFRFKENFSIKRINDEYIAQRNIYHCMNQNMNIKKNIISLEPNLDIIAGSRDLPKIEFNLYYELMKHNYLEKRMKVSDYDYVILLVSPILNQMTMNILTYATEAISLVQCTPEGYDYQEKMNRFMHYLKRFYAKELFFSRIVPYYDTFLDKETYGLFTSEMTYLLVTPPISLNDMKTVQSITMLILDDESKFDSSVNKIERQRHIDEYYNTASSEISLEEFTKKKI